MAQVAYALQLDAEPEREVVRASLNTSTPAITRREEALSAPQQWVASDRNRFRQYFKGLQVIPIFKKAEERLQEMASLQANWDTYGAAPPSGNARARARTILAALRDLTFPPTKVVASSEGGVAICFVAGDHYADIESLNTGEILAVKYVGAGEPDVWEVNPDNLVETIEQIRAHFG